MIACCWCKRACATGDANIQPEQVVFCLFCGTMQLVVRRSVGFAGPISSRFCCLSTRPLTIEELNDQLGDSDTMRILCEMEGEGRHHA